jgi:7-cyano-7-deazaguanine synthase in queuosine biosynthesis/predicted glutamine amidotransferase
MCVYCRESKIDFKYVDMLLSYAEKRGQDGTGIYINPRKKDKPAQVFKSIKKYSDCKEEVKEFVEKYFSLGGLLIGVQRAAPETEPHSTIKNLQPIYNNNVCVVHNGSVSNRIHRELQEWAKNSSEYTFLGDNDSESILAEYIRCGRNLKDAMEKLSGGFSVILYDELKDMLFTAQDFKILAHGYLRGYGFFLHSDNDAIGEVITDITQCERDGICMFEDFYHHSLSGERIKQIDLTSGFMHNIKFNPRYITPTFDTSKKPAIKNELCLVSSSSGLDSTCTLKILQLSGYKNIIAVHYKYGHRGQQAEEIAITKICKDMNIELKIFDLESIYKEIGSKSISMLENKDSKIVTGTSEYLKTTAAWHPGRNMMFATIMGTLAESEIMKHNYTDVYIVGGWQNLQESGTYIDNSEYFCNSYLELFKYGTLIGNRIKPLFALSQLMKHEQYVLIKEFEFKDLIKNCISCDRPIVENGIPRNCMKNGIPACGSGLLSYWGSKMVGMNDMELRNFYEVNDPDYVPYVPEHLKQHFTKSPKIEDIINRILLPEDKLDNLRKLIKK